MSEGDLGLTLRLWAFLLLRKFVAAGKTSHWKNTKISPYSIPSELVWEHSG